MKTENAIFILKRSFYFHCRSLLLAACEKKSVLMFDPLCRRLIHAIDNAHGDCVNCVRLVEYNHYSYGFNFWRLLIRI